MSNHVDVLVVVGSTGLTSRTGGLAQRAVRSLCAQGLCVRELHLRDLPPQALLHAKFDDPEIRAASALVADAAGIVLASPVYKASYTGMLKCFLDVQPQFGLRGKAVLPLLTGGTLAHVLALDYALRPVLQSMDPQVVVSGVFVLDKLITLSSTVGAELEAEVGVRFDAAVQAFIAALPRPARTTSPANTLQLT